MKHIIYRRKSSRDPYQIFLDRHHQSANDFDLSLGELGSESPNFKNGFAPDASISQTGLGYQIKLKLIGIDPHDIHLKLAAEHIAISAKVDDQDYLQEFSFENKVDIHNVVARIEGDYFLVDFVLND